MEPEAITTAVSVFQIQHKTSPTSSVSKIPPTASALPSPRPTLRSSMQHIAHSNHHVPGHNQAYLYHGPSYQASVLYHHNAIRANHNATPLSWDTKCEANARLAARRCDFRHFIPPNAGQGQNLFIISGTAFNVTAGITEFWYHGELPAMMPWFGRADLPHNVFEQVGHLTQLVWRGTKKVGCVSVNCGKAMRVNGRRSDMNKYTVCNYAPAGNVEGGYAKNVRPPVSDAEWVDWAD
ncbi:scp-like extracellular protein [Curvularia clavata]|uniref:Scp-like extracellular protein n=1 Tax=Curvularia clavata TaxID=95742 RepID=A0A9Q8ZHC4_CURCL|nr:scp-like extracellular protein [Curvularia clavata]